MPKKKMQNNIPSGNERHQDQLEKNNHQPNPLRWMGFGFELLGVVGLFSYAGHWADEKYKTEPWFMISGFLVAFIGMFYLLFKETEDMRK